MGNVRYRVVQENGQEVVEEIYKIVVHRFQLGDVEDPEIYAAEPIYNWQQTESGKFIMANAVKSPTWISNINPERYEYDYAIIAELEKKKLTEYYLRWGHIK